MCAGKEEDGNVQEYIGWFSFSLYSSVMGQEQSAPRPNRTRVPNKLSKPMTNSTGKQISKTSGTPSRQNSQLNNASPIKSRLSLLLTDVTAGEAGEKKREKKGEKKDEKKDGKPRKRLSLFRSKSSHSNSKSTVESDTVAEGESVDPSPVDRPVRRHSRANSWTFDQQLDETFRYVRLSPC